MTTVSGRAGVTTTINLGYPRIGAKRELKRALEGYWKGTLSAAHLQRVAAVIRSTNWRIQRDAGIDLIPSNDFSLYDHVLDTMARSSARCHRASAGMEVRSTSTSTLPWLEAGRVTDTTFLRWT